MPGPSTSPAHRFAALAEVFRGRPDVSLPGESVRRGFGSAALKVRGSLFAMLAADQLVLKLPRAHVTALLAAGAGQPFDAGKGIPMKEWVIIDDEERTWRDLAEQAYDFGRSRSNT